MKEKNLNDLYQEVILGHSKSPYHFGRPEAPYEETEAYNPLCGDQYQLYIKAENHLLKEIHFQGYGCAISKASASVMIQELEGLSYLDSSKLIADFLRIMNPELENEELEILPSGLHAFARVKQFPARFSCVSLGWKAMQEFLEQ